MSESRQELEARMRDMIGARHTLKIITRHTTTRPGRGAAQFVTRFDVYADTANARTVTRLEYVTTGSRKPARKAAQSYTQTHLSAYDAGRRIWTQQDGERFGELTTTEAETLARIILAEVERIDGAPPALYQTATVYAALEPTE